MFFSGSVFHFSVAKDFLFNKSVTVECSPNQQSEVMQSFSMEINDITRDSICRTILGSLIMEKAEVLPIWSSIVLSPTSFKRILFRPQITTTDESLRSVSPKMYENFQIQNFSGNFEQLQTRLLFWRRETASVFSKVFDGELRTRMQVQSDLWGLWMRSVFIHS